MIEEDKKSNCDDYMSMQMEEAGSIIEQEWGLDRQVMSY